MPRIIILALVVVGAGEGEARKHREASCHRGGAGGPRQGKTSNLIKNPTILLGQFDHYDNQTA